MKTKNALYAPLLLCVVFLLTGFSESLASLLNGFSDNTLLSVIIIQCLVFLLPVAFYCRVRSINFVTALNFRPVSPSILGFALLSFLLFFTGSAIMNYVSHAFFGNMGAQSAVGAPLLSLYPDSAALIVIAYVILPAFLEEMVFRSILIHEYTPYGGFFAVAVSALSFAMLHFSFRNFGEYLFAGLIFACVAYVCSSVVPAILLHLASNTVNVFFPDVFSEYVARTGNSVVLFYILVAAFLLFLYLWFSQLEYIYLKKADEVSHDRRAQLLFLESEKRIREQTRPPGIALRARAVFLSPGLLAAVAIFLLKSLDVI